MVDANLNELLNRVSELIDLNHCRQVDERYRRALSYEDTDRPPLVVQAPFGSVLSLGAPWGEFQRFSYRETFQNPEAMLQNMLLDRVLPGLLLQDDNPLAIRNNHGTIQVASVLGSSWSLYEDNYPWVQPLERIEALEQVAHAEGPVSLDAGVVPMSLRTLMFYQENLRAHPPCSDAIQISLPDLQGPLDTAEQLWGSGIYYAFSDAEDLFRRLLDRVLEATIQLFREYRKYCHDRLDPILNTQHGYMIPGRLLVRNDSAIMLSPRLYADFVLPHDARLLAEAGKGSIHFCGNGEHLVPKFLQIPDLRGLDFGQSHLLNLGSIYRQCRERRVALTNVCPSREDLVEGKARQEFPTGVVFLYYTTDIDDARDVVLRYGQRN